MRILLLTPGTGTFLCGSCLRDNALVTALRARGHDALIAPLYLPFALEGSEAREPVVHMGGINVYLQQKLPVLRFLPRFVRHGLDSPRLLRFVARRASMTASAGLGELTLSMLSGEEGRQRLELARLVDWLRELPPFDVILLSNVMLVGLARELRAALGCRIVSTLQGEAPFLDSLPPAYRQRAWDRIAERASELDGWIAVSEFTATTMAERLGLARARGHVVWNGIDTAEFARPSAAAANGAAEAGGATAMTRSAAGGARPPTVGYFARMCREKGLATLFDAFCLLKAQHPAARLVAAGEVLAEDRALVAGLAERARALGIAADVELHGTVTRAEKLALFRRFDVLSVPATYGESFGLYLLEAWASGLPVVQPRHGAFPELIEATGGGLLCAPDDPRSLAESLSTLLADRELRARLGEAGRRAVVDRFTSDRMAEGVEAALEAILDGAAAAPPASVPRSMGVAELA